MLLARLLQAAPGPCCTAAAAASAAGRELGALLLASSCSAVRLVSSVSTTCNEQQQQQQQLAPWLLLPPPQLPRVQQQQHCWRQGVRHARGFAHQQQQHWQQQQQQQQAPPRGGAIPAPKMTSRIMHAEGPRDLLTLVVRHHGDLNHIHIVAALNRAAELWKGTATPGFVAAATRAGATHMQDDDGADGVSGGDGGTLVGRQQLEKLMQQLAGPFVRALPQLNAREVASGLWSYAHCGLQPPPELLSACVQDLCSWDKLRQAPSRYLLNTAWAAAKLGCRDPQLYSAISAAVLGGNLQQLTPSQLAVLAWSFTKARYHDAELGAAATARATQLLQRQLQELADSRRSSGSAKKQQHTKNKRRTAALWQFNPGSLSGLVWGGAALGWLPAAPALLQAAAQLAGQEPLVYEFTPRAASNLLWGFAVSLRGSDAEQHTASSSGPGEGADALQQQLGGGVSAVPSVLQPQQVWQTTLAVAASSLRRLDEADAASLSRLLWSCATLHSWHLHALWSTAAAAQQQQQQQQQQGANGAAAGAEAGAAVHAATEDGGRMFEQLCAALAAQLQRQPGTLRASAVVTARALAAAQEQGLMPLPDDVTVQQQQQQQGSSSVPASVRLLQQLAEGVTAAARQQQLPARVLADLCVAWAQLLRPLQAPSAVVVQEGGGGGSSAATSLAAAVDALAAAAQQLAEAPGARLEVEEVSRMLASFSRLKAHDSSADPLFLSLLQHWSAEALQACSSEALVAAVRAAGTCVQAWVVVPHHPAWGDLVSVVVSRWRGLTATEQASALPALRTCSRKLAGANVPELQALRGLLEQQHKKV